MGWRLFLSLLSALRVPFCVAQRVQTKEGNNQSKVQIHAIS